MATAEEKTENSVNSEDDFIDPLGAKDPLHNALDEPLDSSEFEVCFLLCCHWISIIIAVPRCLQRIHIPNYCVCGL